MLCLLVLVSPTARALTGDSVEIPGGRAAVSALVGGIDEDPDRFMTSLARRYLEEPVGDAGWQECYHRARVMGFLRTVQALRETHGGVVELSTGSHAGRVHVREFFESVGYRVRFPRKSFENALASDIEIILDESHASGHDVVWALGWDVKALYARLLREGSLSLVLPLDRATSPISLDRLARATGRRVTAASAIYEWTRSEKTNVLAEALAHLGREATAVLDPHLGWVRSRAARRLARYAPAISIRDGRLDVPGGEAAMPFWKALVGVSPAEPEAFLLALLDPSLDEGAAYLWGAMFFNPPATQRFYLHLDTLSDAERRAFLDALGRALRPTGDDGVRGELQIASLATSRARSGAVLSSRFASYYQQAITDLAQMRGSVTDANVDGIDALIALLVAEDSGATRRYPHLVRVINEILSNRSGTPADLPLFARAVERYPYAVRALEGFRSLSAVSYREYVTTVGWLASQDDRDIASAVLTFQSGVELLRLIDLAGKLDSALVVEYFDRWQGIHRGFERRENATAAALDWLADFADELPEVADDRPGRGPYERRLLSVLTSRRDPQVFRFQGLDYAGTRDADLARAMTRQLERHHIPSLDAILEAHARLDAIRGFAASGDVNATRLGAKEAARALRRLKIHRPRIFGQHPRLAAEVGDSERDLLLQRLALIKAQAKRRQLRRLEEGVRGATAAFFHPLRHALLGLVYVSAVDELNNFLFEEEGLVQRHTMMRFYGTRDDLRLEGDNAWAPARIVPNRQSPLGVRIAGPVRGVRSSMAAFARLEGEEISPGLAINSSRKRTLLLSAIDTRWDDISPELARIVAFAAPLGRRIFARAVEEFDAGGGPAFDFVTRRVPLVRLERINADDGSRVLLTPADALIIGIAALDGDEFGAPPRGLVTDDEARRFGLLVEAVGPDWRVLLTQTIATDGPRAQTHVSWASLWPPYEVLVAARDPEAVHQREALDLRVRIVEFLGSRSLPGRVGADLFVLALEPQMPKIGELEELDWPRFVRWVAAIEDDALEEDMRTCLVRGLYELQL